MKKIALSIIIIAAMIVSCKETTEKTEVAIDSTITEVTDTIETVTDSSTNIIDSTKVKIEETVKVKLKKVNE